MYLQNRKSGIVYEVIGVRLSVTLGEVYKVKSPFETYHEIYAVDVGWWPKEFKRIIPMGV